MGKKKNKQSNNNDKDGGKQTEVGGDKEKKENGGGGGGGKDNITVVLKADLHCEGCATKVIKCIRSFDGVDTVSIDEGQKITVVGNVDPAKLREKVEQKTHKKVELISPQPKKENKGDNKENDKGKENKKDDSKNKNSNKSDDKKSKDKEKEPPVTTAVFKVHLHCEGCIQKIYKIATKTKGYQDMKIDKQKDTVTVTGAMDMKALAEVLKKHLKKDVVIVPPKKEGEKKDDGGGGKEKGGGGGGGGKGGGSGGEAADGGGGDKIEGNRMQMQVGYPYPYPYPFMYGSGPVVDQFQYNPYAAGPPHHAPQIFSDENPNACIVM